MIQPVRVVNQAEQGPGRGAPGEQPQRREPDQETIGRRAVFQAEGQPEGGALRRRKLTGRVQFGRSSWCRAAKLSSISLSTPPTRATWKSGALAAR